MMWFLLFILLMLIGVLIWFHRKSAQEWERELAYLMRHEQDGQNQSGSDPLLAESNYRQVAVSPMLSNARDVAKSKQKAMETRELAEQLKETSLPTPKRRGAQQAGSDELLPMFDSEEPEPDAGEGRVDDEDRSDFALTEADMVAHGAAIEQADAADHAVYLDHIPQAPSKPVEVITLATATELAAKVAAVKKKPAPIVVESPRETIRLVTQKQIEPVAAPQVSQQAYQATEPTQAQTYTVAKEGDALPVIGLDDIRVNLLKQRETRRRQQAEDQAEQHKVLPVIEVEEAFANLAHAKVPYSRGAPVAKQMVTRSSVIPSSARVIGPHAVAQTPQAPAAEPAGPISSRFTPFEHAPYTPPAAKQVATKPTPTAAPVERLQAAAVAPKPLASLLQVAALDEAAVTAVDEPLAPSVEVHCSVIAGDDLVVDAPTWRIEDRLIAESEQPLIIVPEADVAPTEAAQAVLEEPVSEAPTQAKPILKEATALSFEVLDEVVSVLAPEPEPE
ncbi:MAG: hypothetical protein ACTJHL_08200, partial [Neisseriaceae bacterium]